AADDQDGLQDRVDVPRPPAGSGPRRRRRAGADLVHLPPVRGEFAAAGGLEVLLQRREQQPALGAIDQLAKLEGGLAGERDAAAGAAERDGGHGQYPRGEPPGERVTRRRMATGP